MNAQDYMQKYVDALRATAVTNNRGEGLEFSQGVRLAVDIVRSSTGLFFVGNGGSASIASHFALDFWQCGGRRAFCFNDGAQMSALANDIGVEDIFRAPLEMFGGPGDVLFAVSSSGQSQDLLRAAEVARSEEMAVVTLSGFSRNNPLGRLGLVNFYVPSKSYGFVESAHAVILHCILDLFVAGEEAKP